jgi:uncharacterized protein (DUF2062 family)
MIRRTLKKTSRNEKLEALISKYKIPREYLSASRRMVSKGVFLGLFIAFIPMPMQMLAVVALVPFTRFNVPIAIAMCWLSNPFTMPPMYYMEYLTGSFILGMEVAPVEMTLDWFSNNFDNIFIPLYTGTLFFSVVISSLAYYFVNHFWKTSVYKYKKLHRNHRKK